MKRSPSTFKIWFASVFVSVILAGFVSLAVQQNYRQSANDPQEQLAHEGADALNAGAAPASVLPAEQPVNVAKSLSPFVIVYDQSGHVLVSSGQLNGATPALPAGVLANASAHGEDRLTWQPAPGVREAAVVVHEGSHSVLAARSLGEVEQRENQLTLATGVVLVVLIAGLSIIFWVF